VQDVDTVFSDAKASLLGHANDASLHVNEALGQTTVDSNQKKMEAMEHKRDEALKTTLVVTEAEQQSISMSCANFIMLLGTQDYIGKLFFLTASIAGAPPPLPESALPFLAL
jgi:hypothetical protein